VAGWSLLSKMGPRKPSPSLFAVGEGRLAPNMGPRKSSPQDLARLWPKVVLGGASPPYGPRIGRWRVAVLRHGLLPPQPLWPASSDSPPPGMRIGRWPEAVFPRHRLAWYQALWPLGCQPLWPAAIASCNELCFLNPLEMDPFRGILRPLPLM